MTKTGLKSWLKLAENRRNMLKRISKVIATSSDIVDELLSYDIPKSKISYIPNGVNTDVFFPVSDVTQKSKIRRELGLNDIPTVLFVGGINRRKQPHRLIKAIANLNDQGIDCQLILAGPETEKPYASELKKLANQLKIERQIIWFGFTKDVAHLYRAADIFALLSSNEGLPNALLEAMATGLPSLVTAIPGITDLIDNDISGRFTSLQEAEIEQGLFEYFDNKNLRNQHGKAAREKILECFSTKSVLKSHLKLFETISK